MDSPLLASNPSSPPPRLGLVFDSFSLDYADPVTPLASTSPPTSSFAKNSTTTNHTKHVTFGNNPSGGSTNALEAPPVILSASSKKISNRKKRKRGAHSTGHVWKRRNLSSEPTLGRPFVNKARKLLHLFWTKDCGKKDLKTYAQTARDIQLGFQKLVDAVLDGVWSSSKSGSVARALHRLEGMTWTLVNECVVFYEIGASTLNRILDEIGRAWSEALLSLLPLHSEQYQDLETPSSIAWQISFPPTSSSTSAAAAAVVAQRIKIEKATHSKNTKQKKDTTAAQHSFSSSPPKFVSN